MAKLAIFALLIVALVAMASATRYTVVTTSEFDEGDTEFPMCDSELQSKSLRQCGLYMMQRMSIAGGLVFPLKGTLLRNCCSELGSVSPPCRCEALKKMMSGLPTLPSMIGKSEDYWQVAKNLPQQCKLPYSPSCSTGGYY